MQIPNLFPGQEYLASKMNAHGVEEVVYAYRTQHGVFFSCTGATEEEVRDKCLSWLVSQERHRHQL